VQPLTGQSVLTEGSLRRLINAATAAAAAAAVNSLSAARRTSTIAHCVVD